MDSVCVCGGEAWVQDQDQDQSGSVGIGRDCNCLTIVEPN